MIAPSSHPPATAAPAMMTRYSFEPCVWTSSPAICTERGTAGRTPGRTCPNKNTKVMLTLLVRPGLCWPGLAESRRDLDRVMSRGGIAMEFALQFRLLPIFGRFLGICCCWCCFWRVPRVQMGRQQPRLGPLEGGRFLSPKWRWRGFRESVLIHGKWIHFSTGDFTDWASWA